MAAALLVTVSCNKPAEPGTIAVFLGDKTSYWETMADAITDEAYLYNAENVVKFHFTDDAGGTAAMTEAMKSLSGISDLKGIIFTPSFEGAEDALADAVRSLGVPIVVVDKFLTTESPLLKLHCSQVFTSDKQEAINLYDIARNNFITHMMIVSSRDERSKTRAGAVTSLDEDAEYVEIDASAASTQLAAALEEHPDTDGVIIMDGSIVDNALLDVLDGIKVYTFDVSQTIYDAIISGKIVGALVPDVDTIGRLAVRFVFSKTTDGASVVNAIYMTL